MINIRMGCYLPMKIARKRSVDAGVGGRSLPLLNMYGYGQTILLMSPIWFYPNAVMRCYGNHLY